MTVKDIAKLCGVSVATVSRVFNEPEKVKPETRAKVLQVAEKYGYVSHAVARSLRKRRTGVFLLTVMSKVESVFEDSYVSKFLKGAVRYFSEKGLKLIVDCFTKGDVREYYTKLVRSRLVDGYILMDIKENDERIDLLKNLGVPFVCVGQNSRKDFIFVDTNNRKGGQIAAQHLCELGCRKLLYVGGEPDLPFEKERLAGFKEVALKHGSQITVTYSHYDRNKTLEIFSTYDIKQFDGIFCTSDAVAYIVLRYMEENRVEIPLVGFDNILISEIAGITTVDQQIELVGQKAAEKIHKLSLREKVKSEIIDVQLIVRGTKKFMREK
ncbi:LacI family DNA-binding transcriptional regulator [Pseudothermotoga thermarum]|uniref:Transcriptional regulator, LacI family n=1 Tax=Pseudothermotoga thermarum DSM 5069 TaxID=688269 RepID=F7YU17_9THEM|nr:LacI family DNA-binding transcriptional regulator [Pseudothermotoga thermarum]AEH51600.1 transcriptional regulator, LacI family [Pseudothermotoga thermarum DSM 5069]